MTPPLSDPLRTCTCGHPREAHIYHTGACRPGFICEAGCTEFVPATPLRVAVSRAIEREHHDAVTLSPMAEAAAAIRVVLAEIAVEMEQDRAKWHASTPVGQYDVSKMVPLDDVFDDMGAALRALGEASA